MVTEKGFMRSMDRETALSRESCDGLLRMDFFYIYTQRTEENPAEPVYPDDIEDWDDFEDAPPEE